MPKGKKTKESPLKQQLCSKCKKPLTKVSDVSVQCDVSETSLQQGEASSSAATATYSLKALNTGRETEPDNNVKVETASLSSQRSSRKVPEKELTSSVNIEYEEVSPDVVIAAPDALEQTKDDDQLSYVSRSFENSEPSLKGSKKWKWGVSKLLKSKKRRNSQLSEGGSPSLQGSPSLRGGVRRKSRSSSIFEHGDISYDGGVYQGSEAGTPDVRSEVDVKLESEGKTKSTEVDPVNLPEVKTNSEVGKSPKSIKGKEHSLKSELELPSVNASMSDVVDEHYKVLEPEQEHEMDAETNKTETKETSSHLYLRDGLSSEISVPDNKSEESIYEDIDANIKGVEIDINNGSKAREDSITQQKEGTDNIKSQEETDEHNKKDKNDDEDEDKGDNSSETFKPISPPGSDHSLSSSSSSSSSSSESSDSDKGEHKKSKYAQGKASSPKDVSKKDKKLSTKTKNANIEKEETVNIKAELDTAQNNIEANQKLLSISTEKESDRQQSSSEIKSEIQATNVVEQRAENINNDVEKDSNVHTETTVEGSSKEEAVEEKQTVAESLTTAIANLRHKKKGKNDEAKTEDLHRKSVKGKGRLKVISSQESDVSSSNSSADHNDDKEQFISSKQLIAEEAVKEKTKEVKVSIADRETRSVKEMKKYFDDKERARETNVSKSEIKMSPFALRLGSGGGKKVGDKKIEKKQTNQNEEESNSKRSEQKNVSFDKSKAMKMTNINDVELNANIENNHSMQNTSQEYSSDGSPTQNKRKAFKKSKKSGRTLQTLDFKSKQVYHWKDIRSNSSEDEHEDESKKANQGKVFKRRVGGNIIVGKGVSDSDTSCYDLGGISLPQTLKAVGERDHSEERKRQDSDVDIKVTEEHSFEANMKIEGEVDSDDSREAAFNKDLSTDNSISDSQHHNTEVNSSAIVEHSSFVKEEVYKIERKQGVVKSFETSGSQKTFSIGEVVQKKTLKKFENNGVKKLEVDRVNRKVDKVEERIKDGSLKSMQDNEKNVYEVEFLDLNSKRSSNSKGKDNEGRYLSATKSAESSIKEEVSLLESKNFVDDSGSTDDDYDLLNLVQKLKQSRKNKLQKAKKQNLELEMQLNKIKEKRKRKEAKNENKKMDESKKKVKEGKIVPTRITNPYGFDEDPRVESLMKANGVTEEHRNGKDTLREYHRTSKISRHNSNHSNVHVETAFTKETKEKLTSVEKRKHESHKGTIRHAEYHEGIKKQLSSESHTFQHEKCRKCRSSSRSHKMVISIKKAKNKNKEDKNKSSKETKTQSTKLESTTNIETDQGGKGKGSGKSGFKFRPLLVH